MTNQWTKEEIYKAITEWQEDAGEDFLDYFDSSLNVVNYMFWCLGKGYISQEQFNLWEKAMEEGEYEAEWPTHTVHCCSGDMTPYAIVTEETWTEEGQEKAYGYLAEFIASSTIYKNRLTDFLEEN